MLERYKCRKDKIVEDKIVEDKILERLKSWKDKVLKR